MLMLPFDVNDILCLEGFELAVIEEELHSQFGRPDYYIWSLYKGSFLKLLKKILIHIFEDEIEIF